MYKKRTILIDLDGVLNEYNGNYDENYIPDKKEGVDEFLKRLSDDYSLVLFTTRNLLLSAKWLIDNDLDKYFKDITNTKIPAVLQIDDRVLCFKGDFERTIEEVVNFKVYNK